MDPLLGEGRWNQPRLKPRISLAVAVAAMATVPLGFVSAATLHVSLESLNPTIPYGSWATAATNIQQAVDAATTGDEIVVTNGVYGTGGQSVYGVITNRVAVTKALALRSVNGPQFTIIEGAMAINVRMRCVYLTNGASLSGFTLTNGHAWFSGDKQREQSGGGAYSNVLYNCVLTGNSAKYYGGGTFACTLHNCLLIGNSAGRDGGGSYLGALYNCTLTGNSAQQLGGGVYAGTLYNCIVYFNTAPGGVNEVSGTAKNCCTTPLPVNGVGNIDADPGFVNPAAGDFRLRPGSPCIDAGTNLIALISTDILGLPRPLDGNGDGIARFDIGAYEFNPYRFEPAPQWTANGLLFTVNGEPGKTVRIERSQNLLDWEDVATVPIPASGQTLIDPAAASKPFLFHRSASLP